MTTDAANPGSSRRRRIHATVAVRLTIAVGTFFLVALGLSLYFRGRAQANSVALDRSPKAVSVIAAKPGLFQAERRYVGTIQPWVIANVGPQLIAAFTDTVLVRPGDTVRRGQVLATLDCRDANATNRAVAAQARAIDTKQKAMANEAARIGSMVDGGFAAANEAEQKLALSESELAELMATQAKLAGTSLAVNDCTLRAAFDGEVSARYVDPGAFVRPGTAIISIVDRTTVRACADVPESDFAYVNPGTKVELHLLATQANASGVIARLSPAADTSTRTLHFEIDLPDPNHTIPVGTTAELAIKIGTPEPAMIVPTAAASVREKTASLFVVDGSVAKRQLISVKGESLGLLYLDPSLNPGSAVVIEGRALLNDGDRVAATVVAPPQTVPTSPRANP